MAKIGFIGLGHMGNPMVKNLLRHKHEVVVYDLVDEAVHALVQEGAVAATSVVAVTETTDVIITMLQTGAQVQQCCLGDKGIFAHIQRTNALYIDCSSIDISASKQLHEKAKNLGIAMLDAPVSGGVAAAVAGTLTFMVGGETANFHKANSILAAMGKNIIHAGAESHGVAAKICNNMILGVSMIAVSEAFILANKLGLDPQKLFDISTHASGQCWSLSQYCPWPNILPNVPSSHHYQPGFTAQMMLKDLMLSQDAAAYANIDTPLGEHAKALFQQFVDDDHGQLDFSGIIEMLKKQS